MKFVCYKDTIIKALNSVVKGVASKTTMPILEGILIQTNEGEIKLKIIKKNVCKNFRLKNTFQILLTEMLDWLSTHTLWKSCL